jgi:rhodanese-related sulfurtransferase
MYLYQEVSADEVMSLMTEAPFLLIDVRNENETANGMIAGAMHVPLAMIPVQYQGFVKTGNIIFYCHSGVRSAHAAAYVSSKGRANVYTLIGGIVAWEKAGYSLAPNNQEK